MLQKGGCDILNNKLIKINKYMEILFIWFTTYNLK